MHTDKYGPGPFDGDCMLCQQGLTVRCCGEDAERSIVGRCGGGRSGKELQSTTESKAGHGTAEAGWLWEQCL